MGVFKEKIRFYSYLTIEGLFIVLWLFKDIKRQVSWKKVACI